MIECPTSFALFAKGGKADPTVRVRQSIHVKGAVPTLRKRREGSTASRDRWGTDHLLLWASRLPDSRSPGGLSAIGQACSLSQFSQLLNKGKADLVYAGGRALRRSVKVSGLNQVLYRWGTGLKPVFKRKSLYAGLKFPLLKQRALSLLHRLCPAAVLPRVLRQTLRPRV
jgi:hypothetical protein